MQMVTSCIHATSVELTKKSGDLSLLLNIKNLVVSSGEEKKTISPKINLEPKEESLSHNKLAICQSKLYIIEVMPIY